MNTFLIKKKLYNFFYNKKKYQNNSTLYIKSENKNWVLKQISVEYKNILKTLFDNITFEDSFLFNKCANKYFIMSKYFAIKNLNYFDDKISFPYYHGAEDTINFKNELNIIKNYIFKIDKIQVTNSSMANLFIENNIPKEKFMQIPISIDFKKFEKNYNLKKENIRKEFGLPKTAFIIGNFQKDGDGWFLGNVPKKIKGPDIFIKVIDSLKSKIPNLFVFLTGPSRGYVKKNLNKLNVPYFHKYLATYEETIRAYKCLDVYVMCSRDEGGPRALLECFASKVPFVSTDVGQVQDILTNNKNGFKTSNFDINEISYFVYEKIYRSAFEDLQSILNNAYNDAQKYSYENQLNLWEKFYK